MDRNKSSLNEFSPDSNTENDNQYYSNQRPISIDNLSLQGDFEQILKIGIEENRDYVLIPSEA